MFHDTLEVENIYAPELRQCWYTLSSFFSLWSLCDHADGLSVVNRAIQVDPKAIIPLIPIILCPDENIPFTEGGPQGAEEAEDMHIPVSFVNPDVGFNLAFRPS